jgi:hypothetical protein
MISMDALDLTDDERVVTLGDDDIASGNLRVVLGRREIARRDDDFASGEGMSSSVDINSTMREPGFASGEITIGRREDEFNHG